MVIGRMPAPKVKGKERSRTKAGRWRKTRSDRGIARKEKGQEAKCAECGKWFIATDENSVDMKVYGLYATVCKECYLELKEGGKIRILKQGPI